MTEEVRQFLKGVSKTAQPNFITGDFDGNGQKDYALLIAYGSVFNERGEALGSNGSVVAFLGQSGGFKLHVLETSPEMSIRYLTLAKKGQLGFDFMTERKYRYPNDAIGVWFFGKAGGVYLYSSGKFRSVTAAD